MSLMIHKKTARGRKRIPWFMVDVSVDCSVGDEDVDPAKVLSPVPD